MANPTVEELKNGEEYELIAELNHGQIKDFVLQQLTGSDSKIVKMFAIYQLLMILTGMFFLARALVLAFRNEFHPLLISLLALGFSLSLLIVIHEVLHGIALKFTGAKHVAFGGYLKKFIFYAEADRHVLNRKQFTFVALAPLIVVKIITLAGIILYWNQPLFYFFLIVMSAHSLFCAGDIGLLSVFYNDAENEIFTFDVKEEKQSYFFKRIEKFKYT
jgi:hypothetical protein